MTDATASGIVHVRWLAVAETGAGGLSHCAALLDPDECARANRFSFEADRNAFIAAHALARLTLTLAGGLHPASWRYVTGSNGKPEIAPSHGPRGLRFSLSHTRGLAACAVCWHDDIGIDVEALDRRTLSLLELADRCFAPPEIRAVRAAPAAETAGTFFSLWTLKEAFIKATGDGLGRPLDSFGFSLSPAGIAFKSDAAEDDPRGWQFAQMRPETGYVLAVAARRDATRPLRLDARSVQPRELATLRLNHARFEPCHGRR